MYKLFDFSSAIVKLLFGKGRGRKMKRIVVDHDTIEYDILTSEL